MSKDLGSEIVVLEGLMARMAQQSQGARLTDLALNAVEIIDRNLFERTCDVRWWATDSAVVDQVEAPSAEFQQRACHRLGVILDSYTVYIDLWLCDLDGIILANGRPVDHKVIGQSVADAIWFKRAKALSSGTEFAVADISTEPLLGGAQVATYATGVRRRGDVRGELIGVLGIHFDWQPQARAVVEGVRLAETEKSKTRVLLVDTQGLVIAASDSQGLLDERFRLTTQGKASGHYFDATGKMVAFHRTPGYETYKGLGWYGVIIQTT